MWTVLPEGVQCMWACTQLVRSLCSKRRYSAGEKIGTEANPGKSWFIAHSPSGMVKSIIALFIMFNFSLHLFHLLPESCAQLNLCHIYANHRSSALSLIPSLHVNFSWISCNYELNVPARLYFHEDRGLAHLSTCRGPSTSTVPGSAFLSSSTPNNNVAFQKLP